MSRTASNGIGTERERSLHAALKEFYYLPGDQIEIPLDGFIIDLVRPGTGDIPAQLIEIQTGNFHALKHKLPPLLDLDHHILLVHPIPVHKYVRRISEDGETVSRRKSPKRGRVVDVFDELVYIPHLLLHPGLSLEIALIHMEEIWQDDGKGSWRRKGWSKVDKVLLSVEERVRLSSAADYIDLLPKHLEWPFTNKQLAGALKVRPRLAQKITFTLFAMGVIQRVGKQGRAYLYGM